MTIIDEEERAALIKTTAEYVRKCVAAAVKDLESRIEKLEREKDQK